MSNSRRLRRHRKQSPLSPPTGMGYLLLRIRRWLGMV